MTKPTKHSTSRLQRMHPAPKGIAKSEPTKWPSRSGGSNIIFLCGKGRNRGKDYRMPKFKLTPEQETIVFSYIEMARTASEHREPGAVLGQIRIMEAGNVFCDVLFIKNNKAARIAEILGKPK